MGPSDEGLVVVKTLYVCDMSLYLIHPSYLEPVKRTQNQSGETRFGSYDKSMCNRVLDLLQEGLFET